MWSPKYFVPFWDSSLFLICQILAANGLRPDIMRSEVHPDEVACIRDPGKNAISDGLGRVIQPAPPGPVGGVAVLVTDFAVTKVLPPGGEFGHHGIH